MASPSSPLPSPPDPSPGLLWKPPGLWGHLEASGDLHGAPGTSAGNLKGLSGTTCLAVAPKTASGGEGAAGPGRRI